MSKENDSPPALSSQQPTSDNSEDTSVDRAVQKLATEKPSVVREMREFMAMGMSSVGGNPLHQKMNEEHITKVLELTARHNEHQFEITKEQQRISASGRWFGLAILIIVLLFVGILVATFRNQKEILLPLVASIVSFAGGFGGGWGYAKHKADD